MRHGLYAKYLWNKRKSGFIKSFKIQKTMYEMQQLKEFIQPLRGLYKNRGILCSITESFDGFSWDKHEPYSPQILVEIVKQIARFVQIANSLGFLIIDIKPSNFVVSVVNNKNISIKLIDFGGVVKQKTLFRKKYQFSSETAPKEYKSITRNEINSWSEVYCVVAMLSDKLFGHHQLKRMNGNLAQQCKPQYREWILKNYDIIQKILFSGLEDDYHKRFQSCQELLFEMAKLKN